MSKHTPGPWKLDGDITMMNLDVINQDGRICMIDCDAECFSDEQIKANARLISAAPDLIKALRLCLEGLQTYAPEYMHGLPKREYVQAAVEAICKATGEKK